MSLVEMATSAQLRGAAAQRAMGVAVLQDRAKGLSWKTITYKYGKGKTRLLKLATLAGLTTLRNLDAAEQLAMGMAVLQDRANGLSWNAIAKKHGRSKTRLLEMSRAAKNAE